MIIDSIDNCDKYVSLHKDFDKVFSFLRELKEDVKGTTVLEKDNVWANVIEVQEMPKSVKVFEAHRNFLDVHYILEGEVKFGYGNIARLKSKRPYNAVEDYELFEGEVNAITLKKGDFMITFPEDAHIPDYEKTNDDKLVRVVVKVRN